MAQDPSNSNSKIVAVEIYDQTYHLRGQDAERIQMLGQMVDGKMRAVAERGTTVDSLRVAVLAALNIADELATVSEKYHALLGRADEANSMRSRASSLSGLLDSLLDDQRRTG
jgi:cell division protein ZapA